MTIKKQKTESIKTITISIIIVYLLILFSFSSYYQYKNYEQLMTNANIKQSIIDTAKSKLIFNREIKFNSDINRLVSICFDAQQRYDSLSTKDQIKTYRPNCELSPQ